jgi:hypothetical protein
LKNLLFTILFTGISICLSSQVNSSGEASSEEFYKTYMDLKAKGKYDESDKWMIRFAELKPNDLRTKDYNLYRSELKNLMLDNGNYTIVPLKPIKSLKISLQIRHFGIIKEGSYSAIRKRYSIKHPFMTSNGKTLYFDSEMPGGFGKSDLYRLSKNNDGSWGKPENLGDKVNTEGDELYPYYKEEGHILFFSSNGRYGLGGLDIFIYAINFSGYGKVYNAGYPLNTRFDDFALSTDDLVKQGYFKSNRNKGKGRGDLYLVTFH